MLEVTGLRRHLLRGLGLALPRYAECLQCRLEGVRRILAVHGQHGVQHVLGLRMLGHDAVERLGQVLGRRLLRSVLAQRVPGQFPDVVRFVPPLSSLAAAFSGFFSESTLALPSS